MTFRTFNDRLEYKSTYLYNLCQRNRFCFRNGIRIGIASNIKFRDESFITQTDQMIVIFN